MDQLRLGLVVDAVQHRLDRRPRGLRADAHQVRRVGGPTPLPGRSGQVSAECGDQPGVGVGGHQLDPGQTQSPDVDGVDLAGADELVEHRASDVEALGGVLDGQQDAVVGADRDVQRAGSGCSAGCRGVGSPAARNKSQSGGLALGDCDIGDSEQSVVQKSAPRVLVLGPVTITGIETDGASDRRRRHTELVAFLALNPGVTSVQVDDVIGHGRRIDSPRRNQDVSRARNWLGHAPDGHPYLPKITGHDDYRLDPAIRTDWEDFRFLARRASARNRSMPRNCAGPSTSSEDDRSKVSLTTLTNGPNR
jgi:hypothetical protein